MFGYTCDNCGIPFYSLKECLDHQRACPRSVEQSADTNAIRRAIDSGDFCHDMALALCDEVERLRAAQPTAQIIAARVREDRVKLATELRARADRLEEYSKNPERAKAMHLAAVNATLAAWRELATELETEVRT